MLLRPVLVGDEDAPFALNRARRRRSRSSLAGTCTTKPMLPDKKTKTNVGVGIGFILQLGGLILTKMGDSTAMLGLLLILAGVVSLVWGCMNYAEGKGHSKWVGLVGVAGIIGLIVLIVLPDQHKEA